MSEQHSQRVVALDGPAGSGKSTVARGTARALGWRYVDTGASYRAATLAVLRSGVDPADAPRVVEVVQAARITLSSDPESPRTLLDGEDVTTELRGAAVTRAVSAVSAVPEVRTQLVALQRTALGDTGAVAEGRDIGTVVAPAAAVKVYLDARPEVRAARRLADVDAGVDPAADAAIHQTCDPAGSPAAGVGSAPDAGPAPQPAGTASAAGGTPEQDAARLRTVQQDLARRDALDSSRAASPFVRSADALLLDTSDLTEDEVVAAVVDLVRRAGLG